MRQGRPLDAVQLVRQTRPDFFAPGSSVLFELLTLEFTLMLARRDDNVRMFAIPRSTPRGICVARRSRLQRISTFETSFNGFLRKRNRLVPPCSRAPQGALAFAQEHFKGYAAAGTSGQKERLQVWPLLRSKSVVKATALSPSVHSAVA